MVEPFVRPATAARIKALRRRGSATTQTLQDPTVLLNFRPEGSTTVVVANVQPIRIRVDRPAATTIGTAIQDEIITGTATFWADDVDAVRTGFWFRWDERLCTVTGPATPIRNGTRELHFRIDGDRVS
jgi:hypothetical protein